jgi:hypothetical protein
MTRPNIPEWLKAAASALFALAAIYLYFLFVCAAVG